MHASGGNYASSNYEIDVSSSFHLGARPNPNRQKRHPERKLEKPANKDKEKGLSHFKREVNALKRKRRLITHGEFKISEDEESEDEAKDEGKDEENQKEQKGQKSSSDSKQKKNKNFEERKRSSTNSSTFNSPASSFRLQIEPAITTTTEDRIVVSNTANNQYSIDIMTSSSNQNHQQNNKFSLMKKLKNNYEEKITSFNASEKEAGVGPTTMHLVPGYSQKVWDLRNRATYRRLWAYLKSTWTGVIQGTEPILEDLELPHRYRPENIKILCEATGFSIQEMKRIYRGFKTECPSGLITEESFHAIYSRFFPHGAPFIWSDTRGYVHCTADLGNKKKSKKEQKAIELANAQAALSSYSHYVFATLDQNDSGIITFEDFVVGLSILVRGTLEEKLRWTFTLYDQDRDGYISKEEMEDVVGAIFDLMGRTGDPATEEELISQRVEQIFQKMDLNGDGMVSLEEFLSTCQDDNTISGSIAAFCNVAI